MKMPDVKFVDITEDDFVFIKDIYDFYIQNTTSTYYTEKISIAELKEFIPYGNEKYKSFLIIYKNESCGFCYLSQYKKREAYSRTAEVSLYLKPEFTGLGIGKIALDYLEKVAKQNGISVLIGIISGDNINSIKLFENYGFEKCGHYKQVGEKFNKILDVVSYQKIL
jgi:L-amino acid N-acyltransferase YncA